MLALWLCVFVFFWSAYYRLTRGALTRHIGFLHFVIYFFAVYSGAYFLYVQGGSENDRFIVSVILYPVLALAGMATARAVAPRASFEATLLRTEPRERVLHWVIVAVFLAMFAVYLYSLGERIPLVGVLTGGDLAASRVARYMATKGYTGEEVGGFRLFYWVPRLFIDYFASFTLVYAYYGARARGRGPGRFLLVFAGLVAVTVLMVEKYPAAKLFVILAVCMVNFRQPRLGLRSIAWGTALAVIGVFFMGAVYATVSGNYRARQGLSAVEKVELTGQLGVDILATRGMVGQAQALNVTYQIVPRVYDYFGGRTLANPKGILPYEPVVFPYLVSDTYLANEPGTQGSDPTVFFGEVYANWGMTVSLVAMFLFGFLLQLVGHKLAGDVDSFGTTWDVAYFYLVFLWLADFAIGFSTLYFDERLWFFVALYLLRRWVMSGTPRPKAPLPAEAS